MPLIGLFVVPAAGPRAAVGRAARRLAGPGSAYGILLIGVAAMFLVAEAAIAVHALDPAFDVLRWLFVAVGVLIVVIGAVLGRIPPNGLVGIRTPWTMADEQVWNRTHRFTGRLMTLAGVALAAVATLGADDTDLVVALILCVVGPARSRRHLFARHRRQARRRQGGRRQGGRRLATDGGRRLKHGRMAAVGNQRPFQFGAWRVDPARGVLSGDAGAEARLEPKLMDLLRAVRRRRRAGALEGRDRRGRLGGPRDRRRHAGRRGQPAAPRARRDAASAATSRRSPSAATGR